MSYDRWQMANGFAIRYLPSAICMDVMLSKAKHIAFRKTRFFASLLRNLDVTLSEAKSLSFSAGDAADEVRPTLRSA